MRVVKRRSFGGHTVVLKFSQRELATLRRAEAIAEQAREIAARYENGGDGSSIDLELARAEHGSGGLADEIERYDGLALEYISYGDPVFVFKGAK